MYPENQLLSHVPAVSPGLELLSLPVNVPAVFPELELLSLHVNTSAPVRPVDLW